MADNKNKTNKNRKQEPNTPRQESALLSDILPLPDPRFKGLIGSTYADSKADIISLPTPPPGSTARSG